MPRAPTCSAHPTAPAVARCGYCNARLCNECFHLLAGKKPVCDRCALELTREPASHWPFAIAFLGALVVICMTLVHGHDISPGWILYTLLIAVAGVGAISAGAGRRESQPRPRVTITERDPELEVDATHLEHATNPYRARIARAARRVVPLSGRSTALVMIGAFAASAVAFPVALHLPHWVEFEVVLGAWWAAIFVLLAVLLFTGRRLIEDHRLAVQPLSAVFASSKSARDRLRNATRHGWLVDGCGDSLFGGIDVLLIGVVAMLAAWFVAELVLPVVFFAFYYLVVRAIGRVAHDHRGCRGRLAASLAWGALWASLYVSPVALVTWSAHAIIRHHHRVELRESAAQ